MNRSRLAVSLLLVVTMSGIALVGPGRVAAETDPTVSTTSTTMPDGSSTTSTSTPSTTTSTVEPTTSLPFDTTIPPPVVLPSGPVDGSPDDPAGTPRFVVPTAPEALVPGPRGIPGGLAAAMARLAPVERRLADATSRLAQADAAVLTTKAELDAATAASSASGSAVDQLGPADRDAATTAAASRARLLDTTVAAFIAGAGTNEILAVAATGGARPDDRVRLTYFDSILDRLHSDAEHWSDVQHRLDDEAEALADAHSATLARLEAATSSHSAAIAGVGAARAELDAAKAEFDSANAGVWAAAPVVADIPDRVMDAYVRAAQLTAVTDPACRIQWWGLAAIGRTESRHAAGRTIGGDGTITPPIFGPVLDGSGGFARITDTDGGRIDGDPVFDRAAGPTQFIPSTWRSLGLDASGDRRADPQNIYDAAYSSARYLCAAARPYPMDTEAGFKKGTYAYSGSATYPAISWDGSAIYRAIAAAG